MLVLKVVSASLGRKVRSASRIVMTLSGARKKRELYFLLPRALLLCVAMSMRSIVIHVSTTRQAMKSDTP